MFALSLAPEDWSPVPHVTDISHALTGSLRLCVTPSLRHSVTASLRHCVTPSSQLYAMSRFLLQRLVVLAPPPALDRTWPFHFCVGAVGTVPGLARAAPAAACGSHWMGQPSCSSKYAACDAQVLRSRATRSSALNTTSGTDAMVVMRRQRPTCCCGLLALQNSASLWMFFRSRPSSALLLVHQTMSPLALAPYPYG